MNNSSSFNNLIYIYVKTHPTQDANIPSRIDDVMFMETIIGKNTIPNL